MTRTSRSVSFTPEQFTRLDSIAREKRISFAAVIRCFVDFVLDRDATLGLPFHADRAKSLQGELSIVQATMKALEEQPKTVDGPERVFAGPVAGGVRAPPRPVCVDKRLGQTDEERWRKKVLYVLNPPADLEKDDIEKVTKTVLENAQAHPDWVEQLEASEQTELTAMMKVSAETNRSSA